MGHFYTTITGVGKDRREAESNAIDDFLFENGNRHSVCGTAKHRLVGPVPPKKWQAVKEGRTIYQMWVEDRDAPPYEWLQEWELELHTHA